MSQAIVIYQILLFGSIYFATNKYGSIGYFASVGFWFLFSLINIATLKLLIGQLITAALGAYVFYPLVESEIASVGGGS